MSVALGISRRFVSSSLICAAAVLSVVLSVAGVAACGRTESSSAVLDTAISPSTSAASTAPSSATPYALSDITYSYFSAGSAADTPGNLADFAGQSLVVNFWASWCPPCVREIPEIESVYQRLEGRVAFLGINVTDEREDALELIEQTGATYLQAADPDGVIQLRLGAVIMPTTLFVSPEGEILDRWQGILDETALREQIETYFGIS